MFYAYNFLNRKGLSEQCKSALEERVDGCYPGSVEGLLVQKAGAKAWERYYLFFYCFVRLDQVTGFKI